MLWAFVGAPSEGMYVEPFFDNGRNWYQHTKAEYLVVATKAYRRRLNRAMYWRTRIFIAVVKRHSLH
jgi:hypothetical protein